MVQLAVLFAFGFANPFMVYGLGAASIPIIIHLLNRRKYRETSWAAMQFLLAAIRKNYRRIQLEQWLLLAVRTLIVVLVVLAMAKPFLESLGAIPVLAGQRTHRVVVLDGSLSMAYAPAEVTRFEQAKLLAAQLVKDARRGDAISVILMSDPPRVVIGDPSPNHAEVLKEIDEITLTHGGTDLTATFEAIYRVLEASTIPQKEVVFLTDLQATSWKAGSGGDDGLKRALAKVEARKPRSVVIDLGKAGGENRAITDIRLTTPIVTLGSPAQIHLTVRNFGPDQLDAARVRLLIDGQVGPERVDDLPVGEEVNFDFSHTFSTPGDHLIEAQIDEDPLRLDNYRWLAVPVHEYLNVLLVDGDPKTQVFQAETDYLSQALSPADGSPGTPSPIRTEVITEGQLSRRDLAPFDAVVVCNIAQFTEAEVSALDSYLKQGGGVVVAGGDQVMADNYNRLLYADGKGLLPAEIGPTVGSPEGKNQSAFGFDPLGFRHPIVAPFAGAGPPVLAGLIDTRTWQYHKLKLPKDSTAKVALAFESGDPAIVEVPRYRGVVILLATSVDAGWTNWPLHKSYPPVMERIVLQAAAGRLSERNIRVGQPLDQSLPPGGAEAAVTVVRPDGRTAPSKLRAAGDVSQFHFEDTELSGPYQVRVGPPLVLDATFAANPDPAESDLAKLDRQSLAESLPGWNFAYFTDWQSLTKNAASVSRRGELHRYLLYGVLALLIIESILAWLFGHHSPRASTAPIVARPHASLSGTEGS
jgi:Aerotolerance regulator N-terminal/von Willebrand factor type A domain/CARDB